jgi:hypothetical protein
MKTGLLSSYSVSSFGVVLGLLCAAPLFASACSGDEPTAPAGGGPVSVETIRAELEAAQCEYAVRCGYMPDKDVCLNLSSADQELLQLLADVVFGTVTYDDAAARTCVNAIKAQSCDALPSVEKATNDACRAIFTGMVPEGGACVVNEECAGESFCDTTEPMGGGACALGKCAPVKDLVSVGGDCSMGSCVAGAYCDPGDGAGGSAPTCTERNDNGEPCNQPDACLEGQRCNLGGDDKCFKLSAEGQPCNPNLAVGSCVRVDNFCDPTSKTCVKLPGVGQPCAQVGDEMRCLAFAHCDGTTCQARPREGEACMQDGPACLGSLSCVNDEMTMTATCKRPSPSAVCVLSEGNSAP